MDAIETLKTAIDEYLIELQTKSEKIDTDVSRQKSRLFKLFCFVWYGHLYDKSGICKRCYYKKPT